MNTIRPVLLSAVLLAVFGAAAAGSGSTQANAESTPAVAETEISATLEKAEFSVENMTCATCPVTVCKAMQRVEGVYSVEVDYQTKTATVEYDPALTTPADIAAAPTGNGYPATLVEE